MPAPEASPSGIFGGEHRALTVGILAVVSLVAFEAMAMTTAMPRGLALTGALSWSIGSWFQGRPKTNIPRHRLIAPLAPRIRSV